jgi:PAS domain S-box-containing protein
MAGSAVPRRIYGIFGLLLTAMVMLPAPGFASTTKSNAADAREIVAAFVRDWPPQYSLDETGVPTGFAREIMDAVAKTAGLQVRYRIVDSFSEALKDVSEGRADVVPNVGITQDRLRFGVFTVPIETFAVSVFVRSAATQIERIDDLRGRRVGVVRLNVGVGLVSTIKGAIPVMHEDARAALSNLISGQLDAVIFPKPVFASLVRTLNLEDKIQTIGPPLREVKRGILVRHGDTALWKDLNHSLRRIVGTPDYERIYTKWYGKDPPFWTVSLVAWVMGGLAALGLIASFGWRYHSVASLNHRLSRQAAILSTVLDNVDQGISLFDANLNSVAFNSRFLELLGLPPQEKQAGVPFEQFVRTVAERGEYGPGDIEAQIRERVETAKRFEPRHFVRQGPDGVTIDARGNPIPGGGFVTTYTDITGQVRVEDALRISEEQLFEAQRIGRIGHWRYIPDSNQFECSDAFYQIYGWDKDTKEADFAAITEAVHPDDRSRINAIRKEAGRCKTSYSCEFQIVHPDGGIRVINGEGRPEFDEKGRLVAFFGVNQDITVQKRAEEELLRERTRAELANRAKSEFLANMSHEIRTPLNAIIGFADIIEKEVFGPLRNDRYVEYISDIQSSGRHLLDLVNDILDISTIEAGELSLSPKELELGKVFDECMRFVGEQARKAEVTVTAEMPYVLMTVYADHRAVRQIILNLLSNAIKFTPPCGSVSICAEEAAESFTIVVTDTGVGISPQELPKITEPFETGSNDPHTSKEGNPHIRPEGTGLGLAIVCSLVKLHGGDWNIESELGSGTTVRVWFPHSRRAAA